MAIAYTTSTKVLDELPANLPPSVTSKIDGWIEDESRCIDAALPAYSTPFNAITDSPPTPPPIEKIARYLVCDRAARKLGIVRTDEDGNVIETFKKEGERLLRRLADGTDVIPSSQLS